VSYPSAIIGRYDLMALVKSDAMLQYEKGIGDLISKRPKVRNDEVMHVEWGKFLLIAAAVFVVIMAAASM
jgi:hypothetical protein